MLTAPLRERFGIVAHLDYYEVAQLERIIHRSASVLGVPIDAEAAREAGIFTKVLPDDVLDACADDAARTIAGKPREAVRETKRLLNYDRAELLEAIGREGAAFRTRLGSDEARTAMAAFFSRSTR